MQIRFQGITLKKQTTAENGDVTLYLQVSNDAKGNHKQKATDLGILYQPGNALLPFDEVVLSTSGYGLDVLKDNNRDFRRTIRLNQPAFETAVGFIHELPSEVSAETTLKLLLAAIKTALLLQFPLTPKWLPAAK